MLLTIHPAPFAGSFSTFTTNEGNSVALSRTSIHHSERKSDANSLSLQSAEMISVNLLDETCNEHISLVSVGRKLGQDVRSQSFTVDYWICGPFTDLNPAAGRAFAGWEARVEISLKGTVKR